MASLRCWGFTLPKNNADLFTPLPIVRSKEWAGGGRYLNVVARLKRGIALETAQADLRAVARQIAVERPDADKGWTADAIPMLADATGNVRLPLLVLLAAVALVLLIACANVANLLLMRAAGRLREIAIRAALGAGRRRLLQQLLSEGLLLAFIACAVGVLSAYWGVKALLAMVPAQGLPRMDVLHMDGQVLLFAFGLAILSATISSLVPSLRVSQLIPHSMLQVGVVRAGARSVLRQSLVIAEIALSLVLLVGAGLMHTDNRKRAGYFTNLLSEIRAVPGVREAGSVHFLPLEERVSGSCFDRFGDPPPIPSTAPDAEFLVVSPGYFQATRTPLVSGRHFDMRDRFDTQSVIMVMLDGPESG